MSHRHPRLPSLLIALLTTLAGLVCGAPCLAWADEAGPQLLDEGYVLTRYGREDGLPLDAVTDVVRGPDGVLWIASLDGLVRYDGIAFEVFRRAEHPGMSSNRLARLRVLPNGEVWAETETFDLIRFDGRRFTSLRQGHELPDKADTVDVSAGQLLVGMGQRLLRWDGRRLVALPWGAAPPGRVRVAKEHPDGGGWIERFDGRVFRWDGKGPLRPVALPARLTRVTAVEPMPGGGWWVATRSGLFAVQDGAATPVPGPSAATPTLAGGFDTWVGADGALWLNHDAGWFRVAREAGAWRSRWMSPEPWPERNQMEDSYRWPRHNQPAGRAFATRHDVFLGERKLLHVGAATTHGMAEGPGGQLWVATSAGLLRLDPVPVQQLGAAEGLRPPNAYAVARDGRGGLWVGTWGGGVGHVAADGQIRMQRAMATEPKRQWRFDLVTALSPGEAPLVGHGAGLCRLGERCAPVDLGPSDVGDGEVRLVAREADGRLWVGRANALLIGTPGAKGLSWRRVTSVAGRPVHFPRGLLALPDGRRLIATASAGLLEVKPGTGAIRSVSEAEGLASARLRGLALGPEGGVWVGTEDAGLCLLSRATLAVAGCVSTRDGLADDVVHSVAFDASDRMWLSGNRGLSWLDLTAVRDRLHRGAEAPRLLPVVLDERDGLRHREFNGGAWPAVTRLADGRLAWPGQAGVVLLDPKALPRPKPPTVQLRSVTVRGRPGAALSPDGELDLDADERALTLRWSAVALRHGADVRFRYRLAGVDDTWVGPTRERSARYSNLPPGPLRFEVQAGIGGRWGAEAASLLLARAPTFTERAAFPWLLAAAALLLAFVAWRVRLRVLLARQAELERQVDARTRELAASNETLARQSARLAALDALRQRFVGNVSHELRTPLMLVRGVLDDLHGAHPEGSETVRKLGVARRNAERLAGMVEQLLAAARVDRDDMPMVVRRLDLLSLARRVAGRFADAATAAGVTLALPAHGAPVWLFASAEMVDTALTNLLANALKFTPEGGRVEVSIDPGEDDGFATLVVTDTGVGIPEADQPHIFERFFQVERDDGGGTWGTGIGLSLVHELVTRAGGEIGVRSEPGDGARFAIRLPRGVAHLDLSHIDLEEDAQPVEDMDSAPAVRTVVDPDSGGWAPGEGDADLPLLLLVEDHPDMRAYLAEHFRETFRVVLARDGVEGLERAREAAPDIIVSDVMMPRLDGLGMCQQLADDPATAAIPRVLVSAKADVEDRTRALAVADDYLAKPVAIPELLARVRRRLREAAARRRADAAVGAETPVLEGVTGDATGDSVGAGAGDGAGRATGDSAAGLTAAAQDGDAPSEALSEHDREWLSRAEAAVAERMADGEFGVKQLAKVMAASPRQLLRELRRLTGMGSSEWLRTQRLQAAQGMLEAGRFTTVAEVAAAVGMSPAYFARTYAAWAGVSPRAVLRKG